MLSNQSLMVTSQIDMYNLVAEPSGYNDIIQDRLLAPISSIKGIKNLVNLSMILRSPHKMSLNFDILVFGGAKDPICPLPRLSQFFQNLNSKKKKNFYIFDEGRHEFAQGPEKVETASVAKQWIFEKLSSASNWGWLNRGAEQVRDS